MTTLLAHIGTRLAASPENLAIEALGFILSRSAAARSALRDLANLGNPADASLPTDLRFATQIADTTHDDARPDIEAVDADYRRRCVIECKFWAGLTTNQPVVYAKRLTAGEPGALVFIAPFARFHPLWAELTKRLRDAGYTVGRRQFRLDETWFARFRDANGTHGLVLLSWRAVLDAIKRAMSAAGEGEGWGDLDQLIGFCAAMDEDTFQPLRSDELTGLEAPRRVLQFGQLAVDIGTELIALGQAEARQGAMKLTVGAGPGFYGRHLNANGTLFFLSFDCTAWIAHGASPLWLRIDAQRFPAAAARLVRHGQQTLGHRVTEDRHRSVSVPIPLAERMDRSQVVERGAAFCAKAIALFATAEIAGRPSPERPDLPNSLDTDVPVVSSAAGPGTEFGATIRPSSQAEIPS